MHSNKKFTQKRDINPMFRIVLFQVRIFTLLNFVSVLRLNFLVLLLLGHIEKNVITKVWNAETKLPYYITATSDRELFRTLFTNKL